MSRTILIIDDSDVVLGVSRAILEREGYRVITHSRATGSVALILQVKPDLVLLDVNMPTIRGDMVVRMSSATKLSIKTIVLLHSSLDETELKRLTSECGAHGYLRKTNNTHTFLRQIAGYFQDKTESGTVPVLSGSQGRVPIEAAPRSTSFAEDGIVLLVNREMAEMSQLRRMVQELGYRPEFALSATQAVEKLRTERLPAAVIASVELPTPGVSAVFEQALACDQSFSERFVLIASLDKAKGFPSGFAGMVLTRPIDKEALRKVIERAILPASRQALQR